MQDWITSSSPYSSLLIGVHLVDFHGVVDDACQADGVVRRLKFTTCVTGQFTCNDGQCVSIEKRCDQTSHCNDQSDEENCRIINMKTSYNDKIAPFSYSQQEKRFLFNHSYLLLFQYVQDNSCYCECINKHS